jgi:hypothetical protein
LATQSQRTESGFKIKKRKKELMAGLQTPVALFIFNRPEHTQQCLAAIAMVQPRTLLVVADAARNEAEQILVSQTRNLLQHIDWPCNITTHFATQNMGCRLRVSSGLDWVFEQVEEAIILEDDCIADPSFFHFCEAMLLRYRHDDAVMHIGGVNFQFGQQVGHGDYYFSKYAHIWGWATNRRAWQHYDVAMKSWPAFGSKGLAQVMPQEKEQVTYWTQRLQGAFENNIDTWDYQWQYAVWAHGGKCIVPQKNLVKNIGFGLGATHTTQHNPLFENMQTEPLTTMRAPEHNTIAQEADDAVFRNVFMPGISKVAKRRSLLKKVVHKLRK